MEVLSSANSQSYVFPFNNWIDDKNGLDHIVYRDGVQVRGGEGRAGGWTTSCTGMGCRYKWGRGKAEGG